MKSTHRGHCQACGRLQAIDGRGHVAKHGYAVMWNQFLGVCPGSGEQPIEVSCSLVERYKANAERQVVDIEAEKMKLLTPATEPKAWYSKYIKATYATKRSSRQWVEVTLFFVDAQAQFNDGNKTRIASHEGLGYHTDLLVLATEMNKQRAAAYMPVLQNLRQYITWQEERVASWQPADLTPIA